MVNTLVSELDRQNIRFEYSTNLSSRKVEQIITLKDTYWDYGDDSQYRWFKKNVTAYDGHVLMYQDEDLIGYTMLRKRQYKILNENAIIEGQYLHFDTMIIRSDKRGKRLGNLLMKKSQKIIYNSNLLSFLLCESHMVKYYERFKWKVIKNFEFDTLSVGYVGMVFNTTVLPINLKENKIFFLTDD